MIVRWTNRHCSVVVYALYGTRKRSTNVTITRDIAPKMPIVRLTVFSCSIVKLVQLKSNCDWECADPSSECRATLDANPI